MTISMMNQYRSSERGRCWYSLERCYVLEKKNFHSFASGFGYWSPFTSADLKALSEWGQLPFRRIPQWILAPSSVAESLFVSTTPDPASIMEALVAKLIHKQKQTKTNKQKKLRPFPLGSLGTRTQHEQDVHKSVTSYYTASSLVGSEHESMCRFICKVWSLLCRESP